MNSTDHRYVIAIVGNGECPAGSADRIDAATRVVRFGQAEGFEGHAGERIDDLVIVNRGIKAAQFLEDDFALQQPAIAGARRIVLPLDPRSIFLTPARRPRLVEGAPDPEQRDYSGELRARLRCSSRSVTCIDASVHESSCRELGLSIGGRVDRSSTQSIGNNHLPDSAFVALFWYAQGLPNNWRIDVYGFDRESDSTFALRRKESEWIDQLVTSRRALLFNSSLNRAA